MEKACYEAPTSLSRYCKVLSKLRAGREPDLGNLIDGKAEKTYLSVLHHDRICYSLACLFFVSVPPGIH